MEARGGQNGKIPRFCFPSAEAFSPRLPGPCLGKPCAPGSPTNQLFLHFSEVKCAGPSECAQTGVA